MEVRKDFAKRCKALAESTPKEAIANLLKSMLPREPVRTRPVSGRLAQAPVAGDADAYRVVPRDPLKPMRPVRTRKLRNRSYEVLPTRNRARPGTKRWSQLNIVLTNTDTRSARLAGAENVDIKFAVEEGYIRFTD
jgi:hypothetical protein